MIIRTHHEYRRNSGYTLIEMLVAIAIITIMVAVFVGSYSFGNNFDALKSETQRLAAVLRNARARDFNGIVQYVSICTGGGFNTCTKDSDCTPNTCGLSYYPPGGYGIHINNNYKVCTSDTQRSCTMNADCTNDDCNTESGRTNYILFADIAPSAVGEPFYDGDKNGNEFISEYKLPDTLTISRQFKQSGSRQPIGEAEIIFKNSTVTVYDDSNWSSGDTEGDQLFYMESVGGCTTKTRNQEGLVEVGWATTTSRIFEQLIGC